MSWNGFRVANKKFSLRIWDYWWRWEILSRCCWLPGPCGEARGKHFCGAAFFSLTWHFSYYMAHLASILRSSSTHCFPSWTAAIYQWLLHGPTGYSSWNIINFQSPINPGSCNQCGIVTRLAQHGWKLFCLCFCWGRVSPPIFPLPYPSPAISLSDVNFFPAIQS